MGHMQKSIRKSTLLQRISTPIRSINSIERKRLIESAFEWTGTPFRHQGREKYVGCDCIGLVIGLAREFGYDKLASFTEYRAYSRNPNSHHMSYMMKKYLRKISIPSALPGDIFHLSFIQYPQHAVMLMPNGCIIHAHEPDKKVIHHRVNDFWISRIVGAYRYIGLN